MALAAIVLSLVASTLCKLGSYRSLLDDKALVVEGLHLIRFQGLISSLPDQNQLTIDVSACICLPIFPCDGASKPLASPLLWETHLITCLASAMLAMLTKRWQ